MAHPDHPHLLKVTTNSDGTRKFDFKPFDGTEEHPIALLNDLERKGPRPAEYTYEQYRAAAAQWESARVAFVVAKELQAALPAAEEYLTARQEVKDIWDSLMHRYAEGAVLQLLSAHRRLKKAADEMDQHGKMIALHHEAELPYGATTPPLGMIAKNAGMSISEWPLGRLVSYNLPVNAPAGLQTEKLIGEQLKDLRFLASLGARRVSA
ncbi:hypothetical protein [Nocardiopsis synnemataformans]|uniref:hypothetical protein n=1 Tax=Nocardiopsis synnemataformans TaxID=61305 RepID=UPI003EC143D4